MIKTQNTNVIDSRMMRSSGNSITDMRIRIRDNKVFMWQCAEGYSLTMTNVPLVEEKTWKVQKLDSIVKVWCNGVHVFSFDMADSSVSTCSTKNWANSKMRYIQFLENDKATEEFCEGNLLKYGIGKLIFLKRYRLITEIANF